MLPFIILGKRTVNFFTEFGKITQLTCLIIMGIFKGRIHVKNTLDQMIYMGVHSFPIVFITAVFIGMVFAIQIVQEFLRFGATELVGGVMGMALWRELIPLLTGVVIAGRIGAAISAEIGTMKVTEQIDALESMGQDPIHYLVIPRFIASAIMLPLLVGIGDIIGFFAGFFIAIGSKRVIPVSYFHSAQTMLYINDILGGLIKGFFFGIIIAIIGCYMGLNAKAGAKGVGEITTRAVVTSLITIFILNYFLSVVIY